MHHSGPLSMFIDKKFAHTAQNTAVKLPSLQLTDCKTPLLTIGGHTAVVLNGQGILGRNKKRPRKWRRGERSRLVGCALTLQGVPLFIFGRQGYLQPFLHFREARVISGQLCVTCHCPITTHGATPYAIAVSRREQG
jgi:hypothetical protein